MPQQTLIEIANSRPDVLNTARAQGGDPYTAGTAANTWLNNWWNSAGINEYPGTTLIQPAPPSGAITANSLNPTNPIQIPNLPIDNTNYAGIIAGGVSSAVPSTASPAAPSSLEDLFTQYLGTQTPPPSLAGAYTGAGGTAPTGAEVTALEQGSIAAATESQNATDELNSLNAQMQALNAEAQAVPIAMQQGAEGRGITAGGLQPHQTAALRNIALRSLPLQGQIFGAQAKVAAAQGKANLAQQKLTLAQRQFDRYFDLVAKDIENQYNYKQKQRDMVYEFATAQEQRRLDALKLRDDRAYQESRDNLTLAQNWVKTAIENGQSDIAAKISALDPKSPTFMADLAVLQGQIKVNEEKALVLQMATDYPDARILPSDTLAQANTKLQTSKIYQDKIRAPQGPQAPTSYQEWVLAGKPGKYEDWLAKEKIPAAEQRDTIVSSYLQENKGTDGFVSASTYQNALTKFIAGGGNQTNFVAAYPQQTYLRQEEIDKLPAALRPQTTITKSDLTPDQLSIINDAKAAIDQAKQRYQDWGSLRQQIIDQSKQQFNFDISPYI